MLRCVILSKAALHAVALCRVQESCGQSSALSSKHLATLQGEDDGTSMVPVAQYLEAREGERPLGVYALYDSSRNLQYVGYGRNIVLAVKASPLWWERTSGHTLLRGPADAERWQRQAWLQLVSAARPEDSPPAPIADAFCCTCSASEL